MSEVNAKTFGRLLTELRGTAQKALLTKLGPKKDTEENHTLGNKELINPATPPALETP